MKMIVSVVLAIPVYLLFGWITRDYFAWHSESLTILNPLFRASETIGLGLNHAAIILATMLMVSLLLSSVIVRLAWPAPSSRAGGSRRIR